MVAWFAGHLSVLWLSPVQSRLGLSEFKLPESSTRQFSDRHRPMHEDASRRWFRQHVAACLREREVQDYTVLFSICVWHCVGLILLLAAIAGEGTTE